MIYHTARSLALYMLESKVSQQPWVLSAKALFPGSHGPEPRHQRGFRERVRLATRGPQALAAPVPRVFGAHPAGPRLPLALSRLPGRSRAARSQLEWAAQAARPDRSDKVARLATRKHSGLSRAFPLIGYSDTQPSSV